MELREFLLRKTRVGELCMIREEGWIIASYWIDNEDLFLIHPKIAKRKVKKDQWGHIYITNNFGAQTQVVCHYIDIE